MRDFPPALREADFEEDLPPPPLDFDERPEPFACKVTETVALFFAPRPLVFPPEERPPLALEPRELLLLDRPELFFEPPELLPLDLRPREPPELDFFELGDFEPELLLLPPDVFLPADFFAPEDFPPEDRLLEDERLELDDFEPLAFEEDDFLPFDERLFELTPLLPREALPPDDLPLPLLRVFDAPPLEPRPTARPAAPTARPAAPAAWERPLVADCTFCGLSDAFAASAPITPPTTAPTGPATLPTRAPAAAPACVFDTTETSFSVEVASMRVVCMSCSSAIGGIL